MRQDGIGLNEIRSYEFSWDWLRSHEIGFDWIRSDNMGLDRIGQMRSDDIK